MSTFGSSAPVPTLASPPLLDVCGCGTGAPGTHRSAAGRDPDKGLLLGGQPN